SSRRRHDAGGVARRRQRHEPRTVGMLKARLDRQLKGEAGLAAAGAAGQGDEPVVAQELAELSELFRSPDEARQLRGQGLIRAHWLLALQRSQRRDRPILLISI